MTDLQTLAPHIRDLGGGFRMFADAFEKRADALYGRRPK
jgi:hypothetical protein